MRYDGAQLSVEVCSPGLRVVRVAGVLDWMTVGRLAGLVATQVARTGSSGHLVVDLGEVSFFATDDFGALRRARDGARAAGVRLHLAGASAREPLLPEAITAALAEFSTFPTVECAERELRGWRPAGTAVGRPRSSHGWSCPPAPPVDGGNEAVPGTAVTG
ncbi:STAS domain-containing protein [Pseudonocardia adelaidensis]|uniref:STAS domain-containing protein n=1 Tax=Pseudonocardia adelaidensis TaxID=648754 RepID=UPI0031E65517